MSAHTPTPWDRDEGDFTVYSLEDHSIIATMASDDAVLDDVNAALIVRAVNCHDELVAAASYLLNIVDGVHSQRSLDKAKKELRDALAKALGVTP